jgi:hypothetical protein
MIGRRGRTDTIADAAGAVSAYAEDERLRERLLAAASAAIAARERARQQASRAATSIRLARDPVLREELAEMTRQLKKAQERAQRKRTHKLRNRLLALVSLAVVAAALPAVRRRVTEFLAATPSPEETSSSVHAGPTAVEDDIVAVPVATPYDQSTGSDS